MTSPKKNPLHLIVRFSDTIFEVGDVISRHNEIVDEQEFVFFGKMGQTVSHSRIEILNNQIENNIPTYLYLVKGNRKKSTVYQSTLMNISREKPNSNKQFPAYYIKKEMLKYINVWMKIGHIRKIDMSELKGLRAINSVYPISETLTRSSSGYFLVSQS